MHVMSKIKIPHLSHQTELVNEVALERRKVFILSLRCYPLCVCKGVRLAKIYYGKVSKLFAHGGFCIVQCTKMHIYLI